VDWEMRDSPPEQRTTGQEMHAGWTGKSCVSPSEAISLAPTIEHVRAAMHGPLPGPQAQITMAPRPLPFNPPPGVEPRQAGVLLILYPIDGVLHLVLTVRTSDLNYHSGQISLPGGGWEEGDALSARSQGSGRVTGRSSAAASGPGDAARGGLDLARGTTARPLLRPGRAQGLGRYRHRAGRVPGAVQLIAYTRK